MGLLDYNVIEKIVLKEIKNIRADYASEFVNLPEETKQAMQTKLLNVKVKNQGDFEFVNDSVNRHLYKVLENIIVSLFAKLQIKVSTAGMMNTAEGPKRILLNDLFSMYRNTPIFSLIKVEDDEPVLYCFWEFGKEREMTTNVLTGLPVVYDILRLVGIKKYHNISLVEKGAYTSTFNHDEDSLDESRGTNTYSLKWFFESNFGAEEYAEFISFEKNLIANVKQCLGFSVVKSLTPNAMFSFKKTVEDEIMSFPYEAVMVSNKGITYTQLCNLKEQYITQKYYKAMLNDGDFNARFKVEGGQFAESFITAEWLYQSLPNAYNIDLTAIAMGYFKAIEELLYVFMAAHSGEGKWIDTFDRPDGWESIAPKDRWWKSIIIDKNVKAKKKFIMMERLINFLTDYDDLFVQVDVRDYLVERLRDAQQLRNGYFHKDNLSDEQVVDKAREDAYVIALLLFGSMNVSEAGKRVLAIPEDNIHFEMLCEHIHYNCRMSYYYGDDKLVLGLGQSDSEVEFSDEGIAQFSGIYFNEFTDCGEDKTELLLTEISTLQKEKVCFNSKTVPKKIYQGTFIAGPNGFILGGPKQLIWNDGVFLGNELISE